MGTYIAAMRGDASRGVELYGWNARVAAALMLPAHFAEVSTRNAVSDALTTIYGPSWPWSPGFTRALPSPQHGFNPRRDLLATRDQLNARGERCAEARRREASGGRASKLSGCLVAVPSPTSP